MFLSKILLQVPELAPDSVAAEKLAQHTDSLKSFADRIANPDSLKNLNPQKIVGGITSYDWAAQLDKLITDTVSLGLRILLAVVVFYIGRFIINKIYSIVQAVMVSRNLDRSLTTFLLSLMKITLLFILIVSVIGIMGIETSSFVAVFASAGVAIGLALSGTLQNFAGGVLLLLLKPYKVGDLINFGDYKGFVKEIQIFHTVIRTYNNEIIIIPNGTLSTGSIINHTGGKIVRLEWRVDISYGDDVDVARKAILDIIAADKRIMTKADEENPKDEKDKTPDEETEKPPHEMTLWKRVSRWQQRKTDEWKSTQEKVESAKLPANNFTPSVNLESLGESAVTLVVRAWVRAEDYWPVCYGINEEIYKQLPKHGINFPFPQMDVHLDK